MGLRINISVLALKLLWWLGLLSNLSDHFDIYLSGVTCANINVENSILLGF